MQGPALTPGANPLLTLVIVTGKDVPGTRAKLAPLTKKPNTSLNGLPTNSLYSSEPNTYWNWTVSESGMKSKFNTAASSVSIPASRVRSGSPANPLSVVADEELFGPMTLAALPLVRRIPVLNPIMPSPPQKTPDALVAPVY